MFSRPMQMSLRKFFAPLAHPADPKLSWYWMLMTLSAIDVFLRYMPSIVFLHRDSFEVVTLTALAKTIYIYCIVLYTAGILYAAVSVLSSEKIPHRYRTFLMLAASAYRYIVLGTLASFIIALIRWTMRIDQDLHVLPLPGLDVVVKGANLPQSIIFLLKKMNLFALWYYYSMMAGMSAIMGWTKRKAAMIVMLLWASESGMLAVLRTFILSLADAGAP